jgi:hypothetical protein
MGHKKIEQIIPKASQEDKCLLNMISMMAALSKYDCMSNKQNGAPNKMHMAQQIWRTIFCNTSV